VAGPQAPDYDAPAVRGSARTLRGPWAGRTPKRRLGLSGVRD
jgi:hypothetical protein